MSQLTQFRHPIVRYLPNLNLVVRFDDSGISFARIAAANGKASRGLSLHRWLTTPSQWFDFVRLITDREY